MLKTGPFIKFDKVFPDHTSAIAHLHGCGMAEFCITGYSGFIYKRKHLSYQCLLVGDRSVSIPNDNLEIPANCIM